MRTNPFKGAMILSEGGGGVGKTTFVDLLEAHIASRLARCLRFKEPWFPLVLSEEEAFLRRVIYQPETVPPDQMLTNADIQRGITKQRGKLFSTKLAPALARNEVDVVLLDRNWLSTCAYSEATGAATRDEVIAWHGALPEFFIADLTFILDVDAEEAMERMSEREENEDIYERELAMQQRVRDAYLGLADEFANLTNIVVLDALQTPEKVFAEAQPHVDALLFHKLGIPLETM